MLTGGEYFYSLAMLGMPVRDILHLNVPLLRRKILIAKSADRIVRRYT